MRIILLSAATACIIFSLALHSWSFIEFESEPNNSCAQANGPITSTGGYIGDCTNESDFDYWAINPNSSGEMTVLFTKGSNPIHLQLLRAEQPCTDLVEAEEWTTDGQQKTVQLNSSYYYYFMLEPNGISGADTWWQFDLSGDASLPVTLANVTAINGKGGVTLSWRTESEVNNIGWDIYRSETANGTFVKINEKLIEGRGNSAMPFDYQYRDKTAVKKRTYYYYLENIDVEGNREKSPVVQLGNN
jgi:hypothetical protein